MIKLLNLSDSTQKKICSYFSREIDSALSSRGELEPRWQKWQRQFESQPESEEKNFPFEKASNIVAPIHSITANTYVARQYNTIMSTKPLWTVHALNSKWTDHAIPTQNLLDYAQRFEMKFPVKCIDWMYDISNMGTGFVYWPWIVETREGKQYDAAGNIVKYSWQYADGPRFIPIPIQDVLFPIDSIQDLQLMPWVARRIRLRFPTIKQREKQKVYTNVDKMEKFFRVHADQFIEEQERLEYLSRAQELEEYELYEIWCDYDYDEDGVFEACMFTYNRDADVILRPILNPYDHHERPITATSCFPRAHRIYGIGYGQKLQRLQEAISTAANQAIDNNSIANTRCFKARKGKGIKPDQKLYTGKFFMLDDMDDLEVFDLGTLNPGVTLVVNFLRDFAERETGVSDYNMGRESPVAGSAATATSTLALIQEGTKIFDFLLNNVRLTMTKGAELTYSMYRQFKPSGVTFELYNDRERALIEQTWQGVNGDIAKSMLFELTASSAYVNQAVEREAWRMLFDLVAGFYQKIFEISQVIFDPAAPPQLKVLVGRMAESGQLIMDRLLAQWNIKDVDRLIISREDLQQVISAGSQVQPQPPQQNPEAEAKAQGIQQDNVIKLQQGKLQLQGQQIDNTMKAMQLVQKGKEPSGAK
jgi:hypothetical protein